MTEKVEEALEDTAPKITAACDALEAEIAALLATMERDDAANSLDGAIASLREVEQRNVSAVQLVAL